MRYHSRFPLSPASSQRSNPTCSLSLASVSASGKTSSNNTPILDDMEADSALNTLVTVLPADKRCTVPFPKRAHSLLRTTTSSPQATANLGDRLSPPSGRKECEEEEEETLSHDQDPPRKRTRTSAISTSTRTSTRRATQLPRPLTSISKGHSHSAPLSTSMNPATPAPCDISSSKDLPLQELPTPSVAPFLSSTSNHESPKNHNAPPTWSTPRRRRATPAETAASFHIYQTLIHGLDVKYHDQQKNAEGSPTYTHFEAIFKNTRSFFDVQDALLAQRLRTWLIINGVDVRRMTEKSRQEDAPMDVDSESSATSSEKGAHFSVSYQQLVSTLLLRRQAQASYRPRGKKLPGKRSSLNTSG